MSRKIRVAHMFMGPQSTGAPTSIRNLLRHLDKDKFEVVPVSGMEGEFVEILRNDGFEVKVLGLRVGTLLQKATAGHSFLAWLRTCPEVLADGAKLRSFAKEHRIDILHTHHHHHHLVSALAAVQGTKTVWHVRGIPNPKAMKGFAPLIFNFCANRLSAHLIAISNAVARSLPPAAKWKTSVIHNGLDTSLYGNITRAEGKRRLGFSEDSVLVGAVGRFDPAKGFMELITAAGMVASSCPAAQFMLVGPCDGSQCETDYRQACLRRIAELGMEKRFHLPGRLDCPWKFIAAFDVLVLPTTAREGLGNVVLEAHASGVPVVSTDCGGPADIITEGETGFLVPCGDSGAMADRIRLVVSDPLLGRRMGEAARRRGAEPRFCIDHTVKQVEDIYFNLMGRNLPSPVGPAPEISVPLSSVSEGPKCDC